jgi:hypothetical protein
MVASAELRQRKSANPKRRTKESKDVTKTNMKTTSAKNNGKAAANFAEETLWQTFKSHPFVMIAPYVLIPYLLFRLSSYASLNQPSIYSVMTLGLLPVRPVVGPRDERQVLILGPLGSYTKSIADGLTKVLKVEVPWETSNANAFFARDGTVSSLMGMRYVQTNISRQKIGTVVNNLCLDRPKGSGDSFLASNYHPTQCWPIPGFSDACFAKECLGFVGAEIHCAVEQGRECPTSFRKALHVVQHPVQTIQELTAKVCPGKTKTVHPSFRQIAGPFFDDEFEGCFGSVAWYVVNFHNAMLAAREQRLIDGMFRYEDVSLCDIAKLAGFDNASTLVYAPNERKIDWICGEKSHTPEVFEKLPTLAKRDETVGSLPAISWEAFKEAGGNELVASLQRLCVDLGYDPNVLPKIVAEQKVEGKVEAEL